MEETLKKLLYTGVGLAAEATEKIENEWNKLVEKGQTADTEVKKAVDNFISKSEETSGEWESKFNEWIGQFGYAKDQEVTELKERIAKLEEQLTAKTKATTNKKASK
jgi:polyhydroxyalkanoate synthesis regulator phasin